MCVREKIQKDFNFTKEGEVSIYRNSGKDKVVPVEFYTTKIKSKMVKGLNNFKYLYEKYYAKIYADIIFEAILKDSKDTIDIYFFTAPEKEKELEIDNNIHFLQYKYKYKVECILSELTFGLNDNTKSMNGCIYQESINGYMYQYKTKDGVITNLIFRFNDSNFYTKNKKFEEINPSILIIDPEYFYNSSLKNIEDIVTSFISNIVLIDEDFFYKSRPIKYFKNYIISEYKPQFLTNNFNAIHGIYKYTSININQKVNETNECIQTKELEPLTDNITSKTFDECLNELYKEYLNIGKSKETTMRRNQVLDIILKTTQIRDNLKKEESNNSCDTKSMLKIIDKIVEEGKFEFPYKTTVRPGIFLYNQYDSNNKVHINVIIKKPSVQQINYIEHCQTLKSILNTENSIVYPIGTTIIEKNNNYAVLEIFVAFKYKDSVKFGVVHKGIKGVVHKGIKIEYNEDNSWFKSYEHIDEEIIDFEFVEYKGPYLEYFEKALEGGEFDAK